MKDFFVLIMGETKEDWKQKPHKFKLEIKPKFIAGKMRWSTLHLLMFPKQDWLPIWKVMFQPNTVYSSGQTYKFLASVQG